MACDDNLAKKLYDYRPLQTATKGKRVNITEYHWGRMDQIEINMWRTINNRALIHVREGKDES